MTYWALGCVQKCDLWAWLRKEKRQKLSCVKLATCPDHPRRHRPLKFSVWGRVWEVVIYFKFHENRSRGLGAVGVENRPLPLTRPMACTTACTTVQAVITDDHVHFPQYVLVRYYAQFFVEAVCPCRYCGNCYSYNASIFGFTICHVGAFDSLDDRHNSVKLLLYAAELYNNNNNSNTKFI